MSNYNKFFPPTIDLIRECRNHAQDVQFFFEKAGLLSAIPPGFLSVEKVRTIKELAYIPMNSAVNENIVRGPKEICTRNFRMDEDIDYAMWDRGNTEEYRISISPRGNARLDRKDILIYGFGVFSDVKPNGLLVDITHDEREDFYSPIYAQTGSVGYTFNGNDYFHELDPMIHLTRFLDIASFRFAFPAYIENMNVKLYGIVAETLGSHVAG